jgi:hypothetical protein
MKLTTHLHLLPRLSVRGAILPLLHTSHLRYFVKYNDNFAFLASALDCGSDTKRNARFSFRKWATGLTCSFRRLPKVQSEQIQSVCNPDKFIDFLFKLMNSSIDTDHYILSVFNSSIKIVTWPGTLSGIDRREPTYDCPLPKSKLPCDVFWSRRKAIVWQHRSSYLSALLSHNSPQGRVKRTIGSLAGQGQSLVGFII